MLRRNRFPHRMAGLMTATLVAILTLATATITAGSLLPQENTVIALEAPTATGPLLSYQGRLVDPTTGNPKSGTFAMTFRLYGVATGGTALWTEGPKNVTATNGQFSTLLGDTVALDLAIFDGRDLWLGVQVGSDLEATPRIQLAHAPYALYSGNAAKLGGQLPSAYAPTTHNHTGEQITSGTVADARIAGTIARDAEIMPTVLVSDGSGSGLDADLLDGQHASAFANAAHAHSGADITSGTVAEARIDAAIARDAEIMPKVLASDGSGSGLDADLLDGQHASAFANAAHAHSGADITSGTVAEARIDAAIARDTEIMPKVLVSDGSGSGLDADLLDGQDATAFAAAGHGHFGAAWTGVSADGMGLTVENQGSGDGIRAYSGDTRDDWAAVWAVNTTPSNGGYAGWFRGKVYVTGYLTKAGGGFQIDHPLDPQHKTLNHSFVESPDMKNIYDGVISLDANGEAWVELPSWFEALNRDFRYQLTPIGAPGPHLYIASELQENRFKIAGGSVGMKVSWQVTGIRHDPYAEAHPMIVEQDKPSEQQGKYLHPTEYGQPESMGVGYNALQQKMSDATTK